MVNIKVKSERLQMYYCKAVIGWNNNAFRWILLEHSEWGKTLKEYVKYAVPTIVCCFTGRSATLMLLLYNVHASLLGDTGYYFCKEVVLMSRVNRRAARLDVAQMPWGIIVCSPFMVDIMYVEPCKIARVQDPRIKVLWISVMRLGLIDIKGVFRSKQAA